MERLLLNQEKTGKEIQRVITKYNKDSDTCKTFEYYKQRQHQLEEVWTKFESTNELLSQVLKEGTEYRNWY